MGARILIVDDERALVSLLEEILRLDYPDAAVDGVNSGEEALSYLARGRYDLIVADLRMPGLDGLDLVKGVRYLDPSVPVVLMTAYGSSAVRSEALELGVSCYLSKPFGTDEFLQAVRKCLVGQGCFGD